VVAGRLRTTCQPLDVLHDLSGQCTAWTRDVFPHVMGCVDHLLMGLTSTHHVKPPYRGLDVGPAGINSAALLRGRAYINLGRGPAGRIDFDVFPFNEGSGGTQVGHPVLRARDPRRLDAICRTGTRAFRDPGPHSSRLRPRPSSEGKRPGNRVARGSFAGLCGIQPGVSPLEHQTRIVADGARCPADTHARRTGR